MLWGSDFKNYVVGHQAHWYYDGTPAILCRQEFCNLLNYIYGYVRMNEMCEAHTLNI